MNASLTKILHVEDDNTQAILMQQILQRLMKEPYELIRVSQLSAALDHLSREACDLVLLDLGLPDSDGLATFSKLHTQAPQAAVIVFSGQSDEEMAILALQSGAQDYLVKGEVTPRWIVRTIHYALERQRLRAALASERNMLRTLIDNLPDSIYVKDTESRFLVANEAVARRVGRASPDLLIGHTDAEFHPAELARQYRADEVRVLREGVPIQGKEEQVRTAAGELRWSSVTKVPFRDAMGNVIGLVGISHDITESKQAGKVLQEERDLLQAIIESLPDQIYVKDGAGRFLRTNSAVAHFLGVANPAGLLGKTDFDFFPSGLARQFQEEEQHIIQSGLNLVNREVMIKGPNGEARWMLTTKVPMRDHENKIIGTVGINRDITFSKQAEEQLRRANAELSRSQFELQETLAELQKAHTDLRSMQMQLIDSEKMRTIGRLAAGVAHEVKNPLAITLRGIDYLSAVIGRQDKVIGTVLTDMTDAIQRADRVIHGLLDFSIPNNVDMQCQDVNRLVEQALQFIHLEMDYRHINVQKDLMPRLPSCRLDGQKIAEVFVNVFENAMHAMAQGGTLTVRTFTKTFVGSNLGDSKMDRFKIGAPLVVVEVEDTGTGIPPDKLGKVFEPFFTTKNAGGGTGLGLSVCKTIMDLHGGTIEIVNREKGGAKAVINFRAELEAFSTGRG